MLRFTRIFKFLLILQGRVEDNIQPVFPPHCLNPDFELFGVKRVEGSFWKNINIKRISQTHSCITGTQINVFIMSSFF